MKFWGVEVKSGQPLDVKIGGRYLRLKHASLGEVEGETLESVSLDIIVDGKKLLSSTLEPRRRPQQKLSWVFDKDFTICHTLTNGSIYILGSLSRKPISKRGVFKSDEDFDKKEEGNKVEEASHAIGETVEISLAEIEQMLKQKTMTRSEFYRLTAGLNTIISEIVVVESDAITPMD